MAPIDSLKHTLMLVRLALNVTNYHQGNSLSNPPDDSEKDIIMKIIKHKPTMSPIQCDHCKQIWYGMYYTDKRDIIPAGKILCYNCWNALDIYLCQYCNNQLEEIYNAEEDNDGWKQNYPRFFQIATEWIEDRLRKPIPKKKYCSTVPKWVRIAIDTGEMIPGDEYVYTVTTSDDSLVQVEKTMDRSVLKHSNRR